MMFLSVLQDGGIMSSNTCKDVMDRNKIRRCRNDIGKEATALARNNAAGIQGLHFNGRKDQTLINEKKSNTYHKRNIMEEHITLISAPSRTYLGHLPVAQSTSECIATAI